LKDIDKLDKPFYEIYEADLGVNEAAIVSVELEYQELIWDFSGRIFDLIGAEL